MSGKHASRQLDISDRYAWDGVRSQREKFETMLRVVEISTPSRDLDELCTGVVTALAYEFGADNTSVYLCEPDGQTLVERAWFRKSVLEDVEVVTSYSVSAGRMNELNIRRKIIEMDLMRPHPDDEDMSYLRKAYSYCVSVPLFSRSDLVGVYSLHYRAKRGWTESDSNLLVAIGGLLGSLIKQTWTVGATRDLINFSEYKRLCESMDNRLADIKAAVIPEGRPPFANGCIKRGSSSAFGDEPRRAANGPLPTPQALTAREERILALLAEGDSNEEIATALSVSEITVKKQVSSILRKLGLTNRVQAAVYAVKAGYVG